MTPSANTQALMTQGRIQGEGAGLAHPPPPEMTCGFPIQLAFCKKKTMWFIGVEAEQEKSVPPPNKNPGSAPVTLMKNTTWSERDICYRITQTPNRAFPVFPVCGIFS